MGNPGGAECFADRVHRYSGTPVPYLFEALTSGRGKWLVLRPGEVMPEVLDSTPNAQVRWSSFWPVSPEDIIQMDLSGSGDDSELRLRWFTATPPDERGIALTRQRLNQKFGSDIRAVLTWGSTLD